MPNQMREMIVNFSQHMKVHNVIINPVLMIDKIRWIMLLIMQC